MFTPLPVDTSRCDLAEQKRVHKEKVRSRLRQLRRRVRHVAAAQRENALIYRVLAGRFAVDSPHRLLLRMLARSAMRRMRKLEGLLHELRGATKSRLPRRWLFAWKCSYARNAPRKWAVLRLKH